MKTYDSILLDWDGNIAQTLNMWPVAIDRVLQTRNIKLSQTELIEACGGVSAFLVAHTRLTEAEGATVLHEATHLVKQMLPEVELYPDAVSVLRTLKAKGKKLALITSSVRSVVEPLLRRFELDDIFDAVVCIEDTAQRKPHAEPLEKALEIIGGSKASAIMIGDTEKDILAGHNAGVDAVLFYPPEHEEFYNLEKLMKHQPVYVIADFKDIIKIAG